MRDVPDVPEGVYLYGGAMASAALRSKSILNEIARSHPEFHLLYIDPLNVPPDSGKGIEMVANGELSFSESFRPLRQSEYNLASSRGFMLKQVPVAMGGIAFYSHPGVKLPGISLGQIQDIYSGKITNWRQLGGPNLPIVPISQDPDAKANTSFLLQGMPSSQRRFGKNVKIVRDTTTAIRRVAATPGGFGYGAQALVVGQQTIQLLSLAKGRSRNFIPPANSDGTVNKQVLLDGSYPLIRRIFVVYREDSSLDEIAGRAYANLLLSAEGQKLVDQAGYLPIR
jgi:phosphate transport system substrate-binding protein